MSNCIADKIIADDLKKIFPGAKQIEARWTNLRNAIKQKGLGDDRIIIAFALATIRAENSQFDPAQEEEENLNARTDTDRPFGVYDEPVVKDGRIKEKTVYPYKGNKKVFHIEPVMKRSLGNRPYTCHVPSTPVKTKNTDVLIGMHGLAPEECIDFHDGENYRGRGYVQLTGRYEYQLAAKALGIDLLDKPELALVEANSINILLYRITRNGGTKRLHEYLLATPRSYESARKWINGGTNGVDAFQKAYESMISIIESKADGNGAAKSGTVVPAPAAVPLS